MNQPAYVILTSKPGQFRTELVDGLRVVERWDDQLFGRRKAVFVIAELLRPLKITIVDETPPEVVNHIASKVLEKFESVEHARKALRQLTSAGGSDAALVPL
jgi:hypothetical protein